MVENWINEQEEVVSEICKRLNDWLLEFPGVESRLRYKIPFYYRKTWVCYLNPLKKMGVELVFVRGNELLDDLQLLDDRGRKQVKGIIFSQPNEIDFASLKVIMLEAIDLDEQVPYASKRK